MMFGNVGHWFASLFGAFGIQETLRHVSVLAYPGIGGGAESFSVDRQV
jgi:hypothetical protein